MCRKSAPTRLGAVLYRTSASFADSTFPFHQYRERTRTTFAHAASFAVRAESTAASALSGEGYVVTTMRIGPAERAGSTG